MAKRNNMIVTGRDGLEGRILDETAGSIEALSDSGTQVLVELNDHRKVLIPASAMVRTRNGGWQVPFGAADFEPETSGTKHAVPHGPAPVTGNGASGHVEEVVLPVVQEELVVGVREVERGRVQVRKRVETWEETVDEPLMHEAVVVERRVINQLVDVAPVARHEGNLVIIPVLEEVLVVEKKMMLREEVHIRCDQTTTHAPQKVVLRKEVVDVERLPGNA
jgi:uncharacterized protein (TIGR02271 family)